MKISFEKLNKVLEIIDEHLVLYIIQGDGSRLKQLPTGLSINGNGREGVQHVDVEKRKKEKGSERIIIKEKKTFQRKWTPVERKNLLWDIFLPTTDD